MSIPEFTVYTAEQTAKLLAYPQLVDQIALAATELDQEKIHAPERQAVSFPQGGVMLSMPATATDIGIHKLVNVIPANADRNLPTIQGLVTAYDGQTGAPLFALDGPTVTTRRTAALSMLGLRTLSANRPKHVAIMGSGVQASGHAHALASLYPGIKLSLIGRNPNKVLAFIRQHSQLDLDMHAATDVADDIDTVITVTSSSQPIYTLPAKAGRLIIGVGAYKPELAEISKQTLEGSVLFTDEPAGARHEAGDFIQAGVNWDSVNSLASALTNPPDLTHPIVYKTVGCAAWDLAAGRCAYQQIRTHRID